MVPTWTFDMNAAPATGSVFHVPSQADSDYYSFDGLDCLLEADPLPMPTFQFTSLITTEQPMPFFSPQSDSDVDIDTEEQNDEDDEPEEERAREDPGSFSQLGSRLPSLQPGDNNDDLARQNAHIRYGQKSTNGKR
ncbi:hypothetical protein SCUCBS95973_009120 [Sporothrix curviconia]|uniref:Uncharacterized protein n=1 Tax=Sporothrix curviconia TaxID=1260050 RepID=A0ABP0CVK6_9PEZI